MAIRVPLLQQSVATPDGANTVLQQPTPQFSAAAALAPQLTQAAGAVDQAYELSQYKKQELVNENGKAYAANALSTGTLTWQQKLQAAKDSAPAGAPGFTDDILKDYDTWQQEQISNSPDPQSRKFLTQSLTALRTSVGTSAIAYQAEQGFKWREDQFSTATDNAATAAFNDPSQRDALIAGITGPLDAMTAPGSWKAEMARKATLAINLAAATSVARSNPSAIVGQPGTGANPATGGQPLGGFAGADAFVAGQEGGFVANDNNHGPTNFGINSQANPGVDVANLTPEQASQIRKSSYWDAIHADALPPALQPVAYNFAIQAGAPAANQLLQQAGGDAQKFNDLAKQYYASIPPDKANGNTAAWQARSDQALALGQGAQAPADNPILSSLPYQSRIQVFQQAKTQQDQDMSQYRARIEAGLADRQAAAQQGISDPTPLTLPVLLKAYPPDEAGQKYTQYLDGQQLARDVSTIKGMPSDQISSLIAARAPIAGPGYEQAQHDHQILQAGAASVLEQRNADPAAYVTKNAPAVATAQQAFAANPTPDTAQAYARTSIAEQQRLGIAQPQVLTKLQEQSISDQIKANNGVNADQVIQQQASMWGPQWGQVFGQLKDIPPVAKVLGYLGTSVDTSTRQQILQSSMAKIDDLKNGLVPANVTAASQQLAQLTAPFASTMAYSVGGAQTFGALYDATERLTYTYMRQGAAPIDAANKAYGAVMGSNFTVKGNARIPAQFDSDAVMAGASSVLDGIGNLDLMTPPAPKTMKASDAKTLYANSLQKNAKWITSADGKGLVLFDPISQTVVKTRDGQTVGAPFGMLAAPKQPGAGISADGVPDSVQQGGPI